jgi:hypothetical protein
MQMGPDFLTKKDEWDILLLLLFGLLLSKVATLFYLKFCFASWTRIQVSAGSLFCLFGVFVLFHK